jgi:hypothetical protein
MPFQKRNNTPKVTVGGSSASASQTSTQYQKYVDYTFFTCQLMQSDVLSHRHCAFSQPMCAVFTNPRQSFLKALDNQNFPILTTEPANRVPFEDGRMLRTSSSSGNGYPYYVGVLLYEGDNVDANLSATMMKKLHKVINPELKWHMDNNKKVVSKMCS